MKINERFDVFRPLHEINECNPHRGQWGTSPTHTDNAHTHTLARGCMLNVQVVINAEKLAIDCV